MFRLLCLRWQLELGPKKGTGRNRKANGVKVGKRKMTEELRLWTFGESGKAESLEVIQEMPTELEFEDLLVRNPDMLEAGLELVGRQTRTKSGWLDLLAVDGNGRLVVYELKRGMIARDAVAQVLDYTSDLDSMDDADLAEHIAESSGNDGIPGIDDFKQWYSDNFGEYDPSRLRPLRMVLVGLGIDPVAERMVRFVSGGSVDLSVVTFQGFMRGKDRLLARQIEVHTGPKKPGPALVPVAKKLKALKESLTQKGFKKLFDRVHADLRQALPEHGVWEEPGITGISFQVNEPDTKKWKTYIGVSVGWPDPGFNVRILQNAIRRGKETFEKLKESVDLSEGPHGGFVLRIDSEDQWDKVWPDLLEFLKAVKENLEGARKPGP